MFEKIVVKSSFIRQEILSNTQPSVTHEFGFPSVYPGKDSNETLPPTTLGRHTLSRKRRSDDVCKHHEFSCLPLAGFEAAPIYAWLFVVL